jgi:molybdate transport system substrate-binding protein
MLVGVAMNLMTQTKIGLGTGMALMMSSIAGAADIHAMITGAMTGAMRDLQPRYEQASGNKLIISWGPSSETTKDPISMRLQNGEKRRTC